MGKFLTEGELLVLNPDWFERKNDINFSIQSWEGPFTKFETGTLFYEVVLATNEITPRYFKRKFYKPGNTPENIKQKKMKIPGTVAHGIDFDFAVAIDEPILTAYIGSVGYEKLVI